jgi:TAT (twin-arginine translocation) pathway signal sequence
MTFSRRNFIKTSGLTAIGLVGLASCPASIFGAKATDAFQTDALFSQNLDSFNRLLNSNFTIYGENFALTGELSEVKPFSPEKTKNRNRESSFGKSGAECFSLVFLTKQGGIPQAVYQVFHPKIGQFDLLLVPSKNSQDEFALTAVINRI